MWSRAGNATCTCGSGAFCSGECDTTECTCANGDCDSWRTGCVEFRYGQCNQQIACAGNIVCRTVSCTPPYLISSLGCTSDSADDPFTAEMGAPCLQQATWAFPDEPELAAGLARTVSLVEASGGQALVVQVADDDQAAMAVSAGLSEDS